MQRETVTKQERMDRKRLCSTLKRIRESNKLSKADVERLGMTRMDIYRIEYGNTSFRIDKMFSFSKAIGAGIYINNRRMFTHVDFLVYLEEETRGKSVDTAVFTKYGITKTQLNNFFISKTIINVDTLLNICRALGWKITIKKE